MPASSYPQGSVVRLSAAFSLPDGKPSDPSTVECRVKPPSGVAITYVYGAAGMVRDDVGRFHVDLDADMPGRWAWHWRSTGHPKAAATGAFVVPAREA